MIKSMTGFGKAEVKEGGLRVNVEMRSVNSRFLEMSVKLPRMLMGMEWKVKEIIQNKIQRGHLNINIGFDGDESFGHLSVNEKAVVEFLKVISRLKKRFNLEGKVDLGLVTSHPEFFYKEGEKREEERVWRIVKRALLVALRELVRMRFEEGRKLYEELVERKRKIQSIVEMIERSSKGQIGRIRRSLRDKILKVIKDYKYLNQKRMEMEVAILVSRSDITEECVRLRSHCNQFRMYLIGKEPAGRKLDFLLQEMNREVNTIGSKASDAGVSRLVVELKEEIEKAREQVQNIE